MYYESAIKMNLYYIGPTPHSLSNESFSKGLLSRSISLFRGSTQSTLAEVAPYISRVNCDALTLLHGNSAATAGVFLLSGESIDLVRTHLRKFLVIRIEKGPRMYFRFYDPSVLSVFLPTCSVGQLREFFGPIRDFVLRRDSESDWIGFRLVNDRLHTSVVREMAVVLGIHAEPADGLPE